MRSRAGRRHTTSQRETRTRMRLGKLRVQFSSLCSFVRLVSLNAPDLVDSVRATETRRRPKVASLDSTEIDDQFFEHHSRVNHPELQRVITRSSQCVCGFADANVVFDGGCPILE